MASSTPFPTRFLGAALYVVAALVLVDQVGELLVSLRPWEVGSPYWRFGAFGLATGRATILVLADAMIVIGAGLRGNVVVLRVWGVLHLVLGLVVAAALVMFALDTVQIRNTVAAAELGRFQLQAARAAVMAVLAIGFGLWFGVAGLIAGRSRGGQDLRGIIIPSRDG